MHDVFVKGIKMVVGNKVGAIGASQAGKLKTVIMMLGVTLMLFYNLPFELWTFKVSDALLIVAAVLSVVSGMQYYAMNKEVIK